MVVLVSYSNRTYTCTQSTTNFRVCESFLMFKLLIVTGLWKIYTGIYTASCNYSYVEQTVIILGEGFIWQNIGHFTDV